MKPYTETLPNGAEFTMLPIAGGSFMMGDDEIVSEKPVHRVQLSDFYMCEHAVTQAVWEAIMGNNPSVFKHPKRPVENVSWHDAQSFIAALNEWVKQNPHAGRPAGVYCLPSEAQWEYAARGGTKSAGYLYSGSNKLSEVGYYENNSGGYTRHVGQLLANELGLYDMSGNVWEWCRDAWHDNYEGAPTDGSAWENKNINKEDVSRVVRGGSWYDAPSYCRVARRSFLRPSFRVIHFGFRVCRRIG